MNPEERLKLENEIRANQLTGNDVPFKEKTLSLLLWHKVDELAGEFREFTVHMAERYVTRDEMWRLFRMGLAGLTLVALVAGVIVAATVA